MEVVTDTLPKINSRYADKKFNRNSKLTNPQNEYSLTKDKLENQNLKNQFKLKLLKINEIKIFLKQNFNKVDIDDTFLQDLDLEYAIQYLNKMSLQPTKKNIEKLLKLKPIDHCDFSLTLEQVRNKQIKLLHIHPNTKQKEENRVTLKDALSNFDFEGLMVKSSAINDNPNELDKQKHKQIKKDELVLYFPEIVENIVNKAKDFINDKKLSLQSQGIHDLKDKEFDLDIENIREKYLKPNLQTVLDNKDPSKMNTKAKLTNIEKAVKRDFLNNKKFEFPFLEIDLTKEIIQEVNKPIDVPVEIIMKDINYILDNLPIDQLISLDQPLDNNDAFLMGQNLKALLGNSNVEKEISDENDIKEVFGENYFSKKDLKFNKIKTVKKKELIEIYTKIQTSRVYRIIGLLINLIYWIVFGYIDRVQIDLVTKKHMYFKILEELRLIELEFGNTKSFQKLYLPLLILIIRIECEAVFMKKFKTFLREKNNAQKCLERVNEIITMIFDPNSYFNTFTLLSSDVTKMKHKISKNLYPNYKSKINATSNFVNLLFTNFSNEKNVKNFQKEKEKDKVKDEKSSELKEEGKRKYNLYF